MVNVVSNKAKEYYKGKGEKVVGNDILQFAIANGKKGDKLWKGTQDEVNRQIDADIKLSDSEKAEVKDFLDEYIDSTFETLLTEPQKSKIIRDKLIEAGLSKDMVVNGETKKVVDWNKIIGNKKSIQDAKDAITKAVTDLGYTPEEAKNELNALLGSLDKVITDKLTKDTNAFLNKSIIDKAKGMFGKGVGKSKIQKLVDLRNKGTLDVKEARSVLSKHLGIHEVSAEDYAKVKDLLDKIDTPDLPPFVRKKFEEEVQYIFDKYGGNIGYLKHRDFGLSNALSSPVNAVQNLTGITRVPSKAIVTALKTGDFRTVAKIAINEMVKAKSTANTVLHGDVSRGTSYDEFTMDIEGNPRVRYNEYGESHLLGLPDAYVNVGGGKTVNANLLNAGMRATSRSVGRSLEATDTFSSNPIAALQIYEDIKANTKLLHPELSNKEISRRAYEMMYGEDLAVEKSKAKKAMEAAGLTPTKSQLNRAAYEAVERKINDKLSKEFYDKIEKTLPVAKERLENRGVKDPTEKQIKEEAYLMVGADAPLDAVASGEREAQRLTGKNTSPGITWLVLKPFEYMANGVKKSVTKEHSLVGKSITNAADAALQITFPYASSIGRWIEFGFELTPYGMGKGLAYKAFKSNIARLEKIPEAEVSRMGTDYMLRSIQGAAQTVAAFGLLSMLNNEEDKDKLVTGTYKEENYNKEKVAQVGSPKRSFKLGGHNIPIDLLGTQAIPMIMWQDLQDRMKDPSYDEKHDLLYMSAAVYMEAASQAYLSFDQKYGGMLSKVQTGKDNSASLGKIAGQIIGKYTIPFNRTQADIAQLANPLSEQSVDFGTNVLEQMSITKALGTDKPNYDYRGRTVDIGDIYAMSADGFRKMFEKPKYGDGIDKFLAKIDFAATDAYRESGLSKKATYRIYDKDQDIPRDMTPDEYYEFQYETGKAFDKSLKLLAPEIEKIEPLKDKKGNDDYAETKKFQNTLLSQALTDAKKEAITKVQEKTGYVPNEYELMIDKAIGDIDNDIKKALIKMKIDILKMNGKK